MRMHLKSFCFGGLLLISAGAIAEGNYLRETANGYLAEDAYKLHKDWSLQKFKTITPEGAYSYLHLASQLPHATIYRDGPVKPLQRRLDNQLGRLSVEWRDVRQSVDEVVLAESSPVRGVMVVHKGRVVYEQFPGMRPFDNHVWMSNAKPVASLLIAQLAEEGLVDINATVASYLSEAKGTHWESIKIIDVLNMQTGLDIAESGAHRANPQSGISRFYAAELGVPNFDGELLTHNEALFSSGKAREAGKVFDYSSANTQLLGLIIEAVTKQRLADVISERIWRPAGMVGDAQLGLTPQGNGIIHGLISSRLSDMARFGMLYTPSASILTNKPIVSEATLKAIQTGGNSENFLRGEISLYLLEKFDEKPRANAHQWDAVFHDGDIYKAGMSGQGLYVSPAKDLVVVWFSNGFSELPMERVARAIALSL